MNQNKFKAIYTDGTQNPIYTFSSLEECQKLMVGMKCMFEVESDGLLGVDHYEIKYVERIELYDSEIPA